MKIVKWLAFGAAAYGVLRLMKSYGIWEQPTGRVLDAIDGTFKKGVDFAQDQIPKQYTAGKQMVKDRVTQTNA